MTTAFELLRPIAIHVVSDGQARLESVIGDPAVGDARLVGLDPVYATYPAWLKDPAEFCPTHRHQVPDGGQEIE